MYDDEFYPPPEAPVFEPNEEEFSDPLGYIAKIRPIAEKAGICKVRPPPYWQPPFAIDVENFKFTPRVQRLNELGIQTRIRIQFVQRVAKFWELQGTTFRLPHVAGRPLDLYGLHQTVKKLGGFEEVCKNKQWNVVSQKLGLAKNFSANLKQNYEKILYSFDIMLSGVLMETEDGSDGQQINLPNFGMKKIDPDNAKYKSKRKAVEESLHVDVSNNKELAKLQLFGAGPKMMGLGLIAKRKNRIKSEEKLAAAQKEEASRNGDSPKLVTIKSEPREECKNIFDLMSREEEQDSKMDVKPAEQSPDDKKISTRNKGSEQIPYSVIDSIDNCKICMKDNNDSQLLICEGCDDSYHTYCLIPPLPNVPKGDWRCPKCLSKACNQKMDAYGFEQARKQYTLQSFGEMADAFKSEYFTKPVHMIPPELVEKEFWRLIGSLEEDVSVEYGADIHVLDQGSGFPRLCDKEKHSLSSEEEEYAKSGWNLNNLPVAKQSLLSCMSGDISGMKIPWVYVGMCFSAFCWHIEDHWTYSINYLHWGEPKTWYGVPRRDAEKLEEVMHVQAPELFKHHPDVMHHLVTTINPANLMNSGVQVVRTNQCAGEFIITFPRAYHAGFNQGYNFAEAVNFCPADWIPIGRSCVGHYRAVKRPCVFSHEEILCKVATNPEILDVQLAAAVYRDMLVMLQEERELRKKVHDQGVELVEREAFESVPDDERQCAICRTTCFLSAVTCPCNPDRLVCMHHMQDLCSVCSPKSFVLRYRYTLDELPPMLHKLKLRAESFDMWSSKVEEAMNRTENKLTLNELKRLQEEAVEGKFPENQMLHQLKSAVKEAEKCSKLAQQLITVRKHRTRLKDVSTSSSVVMKHSSGCMLMLDEIRAFYQQLLGLPCVVNNLEQVCEYIKHVENFVSQAEAVLREEEPSSQTISNLIEESLDIDVNLPQIRSLHYALQQAKWLEEVRTSLLLDDDIDTNDCLSPISLDQLRKLIDDGVSVEPRPAVERAMAELQELLNLSEAWEEKAKNFLELKEKGSLNSAEVITSESEHVPVHLPHCAQLKSVVEKANTWIKKLQTIQKQDYYPYLEVLEALLLQAKSMDVRLTQMSVVETQVAAAQEWKERTSRAFLKKNSIFTLMDVLSPRTEDRRAHQSLKAMRRKIREASMEQQLTIEKWAKTDNFDIHNPVDPADVVANFKKMEEEELIVLNEMRRLNKMKSGCSSSADDNDNIKSPDNNSDTQPYCICMKPSSGFMLQCELCHDWFHSACVPVLKFNNNKSKVQQMYELKFLCPLCHRSRRPRLEIILSLLLQLQKLPVRIKEGEALQCLTERAMSWQDKARELLKLPEYSGIVEQLEEKLRENEKLWQEQENERNSKLYLNQSENSNPPLEIDDSSQHEVQRMSSLDLIDDTIDTILRRTSCNDVEEPPSQPSGVDALLSAASKTEADQEDVIEAAEVLAMIACASNHHNTQQTTQIHPVDTKNNTAPTFQPEVTANHAKPVDRDPFESNLFARMSTEESETVRELSRSLTPINTNNEINTSDIYHSEVLDLSETNTGQLSTPTISSQMSSIVNTSDIPVQHHQDEPRVPSFLPKGPLIDLPDDLKKSLEELMMEGDLLEVSLDETQQIWKILQASQPLSDDKLMELHEVDQRDFKPVYVEKDVERKRKKKDEQNCSLMEKKKKKPRNSVETAASKESKKDKKKKRKSDNKQSALDAFVALDDDESAFCAVHQATGGAKLCKQPTGEEVDWLQCDGGCENWFHCVCVSVTPEEAKELDYVCEKCDVARSSIVREHVDENSQAHLERQNSDCSSMEVDVTNTPSLSPANSVLAACVK